MKRVIGMITVLVIILSAVPSQAGTVGEDMSMVIGETVAGAIIGGIAGLIIGAIPDPYLYYQHGERRPTLLEIIRDGISVGGMFGFMRGLSKTE